MAAAIHPAPPTGSTAQPITTMRTRLNDSSSIPAPASRRSRRGVDGARSPAPVIGTSGPGMGCLAHPRHRGQHSEPVTLRLEVGIPVSRTASSTRQVAVDDQRLVGLRRWNLGLTVLHAAQAVVILVLASGFAITVTTSYPTGPPGATPAAPTALIDVAIGPAVAVFLFLAALDHLVTATVTRSVYEADLRRGINRFRWVEYSLSATLMIVLIGFYFGLTGISTVAAIIGANVAMILFGWLQERANPPGRTETTMLPFWFGTIAGVAPWVAIGINLVGADQVPGFVVGIGGVAADRVLHLCGQPVAAVPGDWPVA